MGGGGGTLCPSPMSNRVKLKSTFEIIAHSVGTGKPWVTKWVVQLGYLLGYLYFKEFKGRIHFLIHGYSYSKELL